LALGAGADAGEARPPSTAGILALATLAQVGSSLAQQGMIVLVVYFRTLDHLSLVAMGAVAAAPPLGTMLGMTPAGAAVDRGGVGRTALFGTLGMVLVVILLYLATPGPVLLLAVLLVALGVFSAVMPMAGAAAALWASNPANRSTAMGIRQSGVTIGAAIAAAALPSLEAAWGLRLVILVLALPIAVFGTLLARLTAALGRRGEMRASPPEPQPREAPRPSMRTLGSVVPVAVAGCLLAAGQYDTLAYAITYLHVDAGLALATAGGVLALAQVGGTLSRVGIGLLADRARLHTGHALTLMISLGLVSLVVFSLFPQAPLWVWFVLAFSLGMGAIGWNALTLQWAAERAPAGVQGMAMGMSGTGVFLGATIFPPLFGVVSTATSLSTAWRSVALLYAIALLLVVVTVRRSGAHGRPAVDAAAAQPGVSG
jgi:MFS family permease